MVLRSSPPSRQNQQYTTMVVSQPTSGPSAPVPDYDLVYSAASGSYPTSSSTSFQGLFAPPVGANCHSPSPSPVHGTMVPWAEIQQPSQQRDWSHTQNAFGDAFPLPQVGTARAPTVQPARLTQATNQQPTPTRCSCGTGNMQSHLVPVMRRLMNGPSLLRDTKKLFPDSKTQCPEANAVFESLRLQIEEMIGQIPPFSTFLFAE